MANEELKNIKYRNMLLNRNDAINYDSTVDEILDADAKSIKIVQWSKLDKSTKHNKIVEYSEKYCKENGIVSTDEKQKLTDFLIEAVDKKRIHKMKDIVFDKETQTILNIPSIVYNKSTRHFTLKLTDKHVSTLKNITPLIASTASSKKLVILENDGIP